jgi:hypothetical protein
MHPDSMLEVTKLPDLRERLDQNSPTLFATFATFCKIPLPYSSHSVWNTPGLSTRS